MAMSVTHCSVLAGIQRKLKSCCRGVHAPVHSRPLLPRSTSCYSHHSAITAYLRQPSGRVKMDGKRGTEYAKLDRRNCSCLHQHVAIHIMVIGRICVNISYVVSTITKYKQRHTKRILEIQSLQPVKKMCSYLRQNCGKPCVAGW